MKTTRPVVINTSLAALVLAALVGGHFVVANPFAPSGSASASQLTRIVQRRTVSSSITGSGPIAAVRTGNGSVAKAISTTGPEKLGSGSIRRGRWQHGVCHRLHEPRHQLWLWLSLIHPARYRPR